MGGGNSETPAPQEVNPTQEAQQNLDAQRATLPGAAQLNYDILNNPNSGLLATSKLYADVYKQLNPELSQLQPALANSLLSSLNSPTGYTPEQQASVDALRQKAQQNLVESLRTRSNLGGGLYGGRSANAEAQNVANLQNQFNVEDINFQNQQNALTKQFILSLLSGNPAPGVVAPNFINPVASADTQYNGQVGQNNLTAQLQAQQQANQAALQSALFNSLGTALGGAAGGAGAAAAGDSTLLAGFCWVASEIFGGWYHPKTCAVRFFITEMAPKWFKDFYIKYGERIAEYISDKPILKLMLRPLFELLAVLGNRREYARTN